MYISLDGVRMRVVSTAPNGVIDANTVFSFREAEGRVYADYAGGAIHSGYLIGKRTDSGIEFRYVQSESSGRLDGGQSSCELEVLPDGRVRLTENFQWESRHGTGTNVMEEMAE